MKKKIIAFIGIIASVLFVLFLVNYIGNEQNNKAYAEGEYKINNTTIMDFAEKYVTYNNKGNIFYKRKMLNQAEEEYKKALSKWHPKKKDCDIRINLALSIAMSINPKKVDDKNIDETIARLEEAKGYLLENGCANEDDVSGHNKDAQQLKKDIDEFIKELTKQAEAKKQEADSDGNRKDKDDSSDGQEEAGGDSSGSDDEKSKEEELKEKYEEMQGQSEQERNQDIPSQSEPGGSYYGDVW